MLAIEIELLSGRYAATAYNDRERGEWPPHPARFFSALTAALHEGDGDALEREVLLWLEQQAAPSLTVSLEAGHRQVRDIWVPVNDVTTVGDVGEPLRKAEATVAQLAADATAAQRKTAEKAVVDQHKKLIQTIADLAVVPQSTTDKDLERARALLPASRTRQLRTFPVVVPEASTFWLKWIASPVPTLRAALDKLCVRVTRLGHSSSLVRCVVVDDAPAPNLIPDPDGEIVLRTVGPGQLERLEREHERHQQVELRVLPARTQRYGAPSTKDASKPLPSPVFSSQDEDWILFERVGGARILSSKGVELGRALRGALIETHGEATLPSTLSGHATDGGIAKAPHAAFVALPFVGREHADASVQGIAIVLPRGLDDEHRAHLMRLVARWEQMRGEDDNIVTLAGGSLPPVKLRRINVPGKSSLKPGLWSRGSRRFVSATPIALDRYPGNLRSNVERAAHLAAVKAQGSIADACERIDLPRPISVEVSFAPLLVGTQHARDFRSGSTKAKEPPRVLVHAEICFDEMVRGPVLLGAGRFFGLGLFLPVEG